MIEYQLGKHVEHPITVVGLVSYWHCLIYALHLSAPCLALLQGSEARAQVLSIQEPFNMHQLHQAAAQHALKRPRLQIPQASMQQPTSAGLLQAQTYQQLAAAAVAGGQAAQAMQPLQQLQALSAPQQTAAAAPVQAAPAASAVSAAMGAAQQPPQPPQTPSR